MRQIDWDAPLSDEDKAWARQAGLIRVEERIAENEARFGDAPSIDDVKVPPDRSKSVLDPTQTAANGPVQTAESTPAGDGPTPTDQYDGWTVDDLNEEIEDRNSDPDRTKPEIEVAGTGAKGKVLKADLIAALRADDAA